MSVVNSEIVKLFDDTRNRRKKLKLVAKILQRFQIWQLLLFLAQMNQPFYRLIFSHYFRIIKVILKFQSSTFKFDNKNLNKKFSNERDEDILIIKTIKSENNYLQKERQVK